MIEQALITRLPRTLRCRQANRKGAVFQVETSRADPSDHRLGRVIFCIEPGKRFEHRRAIGLALVQVREALF